MNNEYIIPQEDDEESRYLRDVLLQIRQGKKLIYVYNKNIVDKVKQIYKNIEVKKKDFYWQLINNEEKAKPVKGRPRKVLR